MSDRAMSEAAAPIGLSGKLRIAARIAMLAGTLLVAVPLHYLVRPFVRRSPLPRWFLAMVARIAGVRVERIGRPVGRDVFFLANHVSWLDIPALAGASGTAFVAKSEIATFPLIGWLCGLNHTVFVRREARLDVAGRIADLGAALEANRSITIFPEGTTTDGLSLLPFKTAMLKVLEPPPEGVMVQPVLLDYGALAPFVGWVGDESGLANAGKILARRGTIPLKVHFLEPFSPADHPGRKAIAAEARKRIEAALTTALGAPPRPFARDVAAVSYAAPEPPTEQPSS
jgi:1-acyl-sn-glycerol-3-phosphate acyltransferase